MQIAPKLCSACTHSREVIAYLQERLIELELTLDSKIADPTIETFLSYLTKSVELHKSDKEESEMLDALDKWRENPLLWGSIKQYLAENAK